MEQQKMKRKDIPAAKEAVRSEISEIASRLRAWSTEARAIPRHIVDGSLSLIQEYKQCAEDISSLYHVHCNPGSSMSLAKLCAVRDKLRERLNLLEGIK